MTVQSLFTRIHTDASSLYSLNAWLHVARTDFITFDYAFALFAVLSFLGAVFLWIWRLKISKTSLRRRLISRWFHAFVWPSVLGLLWVVARYQFVGFFGSRSFFVGVVLLEVVWCALVVHYYLTQYKEECKQWMAQEQKNKYLQIHGR